MKKLLQIKCYQHIHKVSDKDNTPFRLYVIYRKGEECHLAFNNLNWIPEFTNEDNLQVNYFEALPDARLELIKQNTY